MSENKNCDFKTLECINVYERSEVVIATVIVSESLVLIGSCAVFCWSVVSAVRSSGYNLAIEMFQLRFPSSPPLVLIIYVYLLMPRFCLMTCSHNLYILRTQVVQAGAKVSQVQRGVLWGLVLFWLSSFFLCYHDGWRGGEAGVAPVRSTSPCFNDAGLDRK